MKIYLMRHGETDYNQARYFYGSADVPINDRGKKQAAILGQIMAEHPVDKVYTSSLERTHQTAELVFPTSFDALKSLDEKGFGEWEGLNADQIQARFPDEWNAWLQAPFEVTPSGAEPFDEFQNRVWQTTEFLVEKHAQDAIAIVAHLGVLRLIYQYLIDRSAVFWEIDFPQGTVTCLKEVSEKQWEVEILKLNTA
ncbi:histidine phosphatase family protein [Streptococcus merionis]|uniref:histidine phosphatase family protein n=1 Tax=Streptococcus merionis TaxID=400065 RepID=UPI0026F2BD7B|nr:histidine phosphatase family protein [Streptococcus merionis]